MYKSFVISKVLVSGADGLPTESAITPTQLNVLGTVTTVGGNIFAVANPGAVAFLRVNADNSVTLLSAALFRTTINAQETIPTFASTTNNNPTGTTSATKVHSGIDLLYTPSSTGRIMVCVTGSGSNNTLLDGVQIAVRYGDVATYPSPANGAAFTGIGAIGMAKSITSSTAGAVGSFCICYPLTGLTIGTQYWFDPVISRLIGGTGTISLVDMWIMEF